MKLNFRVIGNGPPLLILHGLLGSGDNWIPHAMLLAGNFTVFPIDLRNHGRSPHADEFNYDVMAADLATFIRDQGLGPINLLGHSMGGKAAMRFVQLHPDSVQKLIVVDMSPREYAPRYADILDAMHALDLSRFQQRAEVDTALTPAAPDKNIRQFLLKNIGRDARGKMHWKPNVPAIRANYNKVRRALPPAPSFAGPTLFVRGGQSDYLPDADVSLIRQMFPAAQVATIARAGHWVHAETPEEFIQIITGFLLAEK
jgi:esterase